MALTKARKEELVKEYGRVKNDTGSTYWTNFRTNWSLKQTYSWLPFKKRITTNGR